MVRYRIGADDALTVRFAISPLCETVLSLRTLRQPNRFPLQQPWMAATRRALGEMDSATVDLLRALGTERNHWPDFLTPPPATLAPSVDEELADLAGTDPAIVQADLAAIHPTVPTALTSPDVARRTADALGHYWRACLAPHWPTIKAVLDGDVTHRSHQLARRGLRAALEGLGPTVHLDAGALVVDSRSGIDDTRSAVAGGITFMPTLFSTRAAFTASATNPAVIMYAARGQADMWHRRPPVEASAVADLLGATRTMLLRLLDQPSSTTALAARLGITASAVNQHLRVMHRAGLLATTRHGRHVLYHRTPTGDALTT